MRPHTIGRVLGTGLRVAGRMAGQRIAAESATPASAQPPSQPGNPGRRPSVAAGQATATFARGLGGFFRPFRRLGGILWLEVTGVFFLLFVVAFVPTLWRTRASWAHGPDHRAFLVTAVFVLVFLYLSVSSFWRARRK